MTFKERVKNACTINNSIIVPVEEFLSPQFTHGGCSLTELKEYGLRKSDLTKLEAKGLAIRTYTKNVWLPGDTLPNKHKVQKGERFTGPGHKVRWLLLDTGSNNT